MKRCKCKQDERIEQIFVTAIKAKGTQIVSTLCRLIRKLHDLFCVLQLHQRFKSIHLAVADMGGGELVEEFLGTSYLASLYLAQVEG